MFEVDLPGLKVALLEVESLLVGLSRLRKSSIPDVVGSGKTPESLDHGGDEVDAADVAGEATDNSSSQVVVAKDSSAKSKSE